MTRVRVPVATIPTSDLRPEVLTVATHGKDLSRISRMSGIVLMPVRPVPSPTLSVRFAAAPDRIGERSELRRQSDDYEAQDSNQRDT